MAKFPGKDPGRTQPRYRRRAAARVWQEPVETFGTMVLCAPLQQGWKRAVAELDWPWCSELPEKRGRGFRGVRLSVVR